MSLPVMIATFPIRSGKEASSIQREVICQVSIDRSLRRRRRRRRRSENHEVMLYSSLNTEFSGFSPLEATEYDLNELECFDIFV